MIKVDDALLDQIDQNEWDSFHDVVFDATDKSISVPELKDLFKMLSRPCQFEGFKWGLGDTCFRDEAYTEIKKLLDTVVA